MQTLAGALEEVPPPRWAGYTRARVAPASDFSSPESFRTVYERDFGYVFNSLRRLGVPARDVEDAAHETFATAWRRRDSFQSGQPTRPWLFGIAFRVASDFRRQPRHAREVAEEDAPEAVDPSSSPHQSAERAQGRQVVLAALEAIQVERRAVFILHEIDGTPIPEVASSLGIPLNTAYSRLRLAREEFAEAARLRIEKGGQP